MDRLADLMSAGKTLGVAARQMKVSRYRADYLWACIRAQLGEQAK